MNIMPPRRGKSPSLAILLASFGLMGYLYFQGVKERRAATALVSEKTDEAHRVRKDFEEVSKIADDLRQTVSRLTTEKGKLAEEMINVKKQLTVLMHEKTASEKEKQDLVESFQGKKDEIDGLKQKLSQFQENEAEIVSLKMKVDTLEEELKSTKGAQKGSPNTEKSESQEGSEKTQVEKSEADTTKIDEEAISTVQKDKTNMDLEEKRQAQEQDSDKREERHAESLTGDAEDDDGDHMIESEGDTTVNNASKNAGEGREELSEAAENEDHEEDDKDEEGNQTESAQEKEDTSNNFLKEEDVSDNEEAHLDSLEHDAHEVDQE